MLVTLITPTGSRPECFSLCEKWIKNQTYKGDLQWVVINDTPDIPLKNTLNQEVHEGPVKWTPDYNTQRPNMDLAIKHVKGDIILFIEDDDYYAPNYIDTMISMLKTSEIAGLSYARYYHVGAAGYLTMPNYKHASLAATGIRKSLIKRLYRAVHSGDLYMDIKLWQSCMQDGIAANLLANTNASIGIKGMPGRAGISNGHNAENYKPDSNLDVLKGWLGNDHVYYHKYIKNNLTISVK